MLTIPLLYGLRAFSDIAMQVIGNLYGELNIANKKNGNLVLSLTNLPGKFAYKKLVREVNDGRADVGFFICPLPMKKIMSIADRGMIVPKKSTYFDPKPADGLVNLQMDF